MIDAAIAAGERRVVIPPGRHRVTARNGRHLSFKGLHGVEIVAEGVELVATSTCRIATFEDCTDLVLRGLTVDFDPLPFTQGRITAVADDTAWVEFEIIDGYPENGLRERIEIYDPATGRLRRETARWEPTFERLGERRYRVRKHEGHRHRPGFDTEQVGDILVTNNAFPERAWGHAFDASRCTGLVLEDITLYAAECFGFIEHDCAASTYRRCRVDRRPPETDPVRRAVPRMRSLNADAFHSVGATKGPAIIDCTAKYQGDDCVNIHGTYHVIIGAEGTRLRVVAPRGMTIAAGDPVEFLPATGPRPPDASALAVEPDAGLDAAERESITRLWIRDRIREQLVEETSRVFTITLDRPVTLPPGSVVCSGNRVGNGFAVTGCDFGFNRSRGILIKASRGIVADNTIRHGWMAAVLVAPEYWWLEAASASDVVIRDNRIEGCRRPAIEVVALGGDGRPLPAGAHRRITIERNRIRDSAWPNLLIGSTTGLTLRDNETTGADPMDFTPPLAHRWNWKDRAPGPIVTEACETIDDPRP
jgi:hypothetical protein